MTCPDRTKPSLADILCPERNSFSVVRLAMAIAVLVSHSYFFMSGTPVAEPLHNITGHSLGEHAVQVFFVLSGILVTQSIAKSGNVLDFAVARALRIFPGLLVCVLLTALVLGPIVTALPIAGYFTSSGLAAYVSKTLLLTTGSAPLPGVFAGNPAPDLVNMSLWTLKYEVICYTGLGLLFASGVHKGRYQTGAIIVLAMAIFGVFIKLPKPIEAYTVADNVRYFALYFGTGTLAYLLRERLEISGLRVIVLLAVYVALLGTRWTELSCALLLGAATIYVAAFDFGWIGRATRTTDLSFGVYIYAAPIQQALVQLLPEITPLQLAASAFALTLVVASASWTLVEKPAMRRRKSIVAALSRDNGRNRLAVSNA